LLSNFVVTELMDWASAAVAAASISALVRTAHAVGTQDRATAPPPMQFAPSGILPPPLASIANSCMIQPHHLPAKNIMAGAMT
jgi:hypothetical protein